MSRRLITQCHLAAFVAAHIDRLTRCWTWRYIHQRHYSLSISIRAELLITRQDPDPGARRDVAVFIPAETRGRAIRDDVAVYVWQPLSYTPWTRPFPDYLGHYSSPRQWLPLLQRMCLDELHHMRSSK